MQEKLVPTEPQTSTNNQDIVNGPPNRVEVIIDPEEKFKNNSDNFLNKIKEISEVIKIKGKELNDEFNEFKNSEIELYEKVDIYGNSECWDCCFCCCKKCFWFNFRCCCLNNEEDDKKIEMINKKLKEIENFNITKLESNNNGNNNIKNSFLWFIMPLYLFSLFHYFGLSEIDAISSAVLKEIFRTIKCYIKETYKSEDNIIRDFFYYLTDSNYHDSSQINFNYMFSFLSLYVINLFKNKYNLEIAIVYFIAVLTIFLLFLSFVPHEYASKENIIKCKNYGGLKLTFYYIIPYILIYICAGFISLLPHKILDEYIKKNNITKIGTIILLHVGINFMMGLSVVLKNVSNYSLIQKFQIKEIRNLLWLEIISFIIPSFICLLCLFLKEIIKYCCSKNDNNNNENNNKNKNNNKEIENNSNDNNIINNDNNNNEIENNSNNNSINNNNEDENNYLAGYIFIKTETIYSFIKVKGLNRYIISILTDSKVLLLLFINLCSRMQKLKFKTDYKEAIKCKTWLFLNFLFTFICYAIISMIILIIIFFKIKGENNNIIRKKRINILFEQLIMIYLIIDFIFVFIVSLKFRLNEDYEKITIYISIMITGSINFILYDYYSLQKVEYIALSGVVSLASLVFRSVDYFLSPFTSYKYYSLQFGFSLGGILLTFIYLFVFLKRELNFCFCI